MPKRFRKSADRNLYTTFTTEPEIRKTEFTNLPTEIIDLILRKVSYSDLSANVRLVCKHLNEIASNILNNEFLRLGEKLKNKLTQLTTLLEGIDPEDKNVRPLSTARYHLEMTLVDFDMTFAVVARHVYMWPVTCFFAGQFLDEINDILTKPNDHHYPGDLAVIHSWSRKFQDYFEDKIERVINDDWVTTGARLLDVLECIRDPYNHGIKKVESESVNYETGSYHFKGTFSISKAWFCSLSACEYQSFRNDFRLLAHSLRRIVTKKSYYTLNQFFEEKQMEMYRNTDTRVLFLPDSMIQFRSEQTERIWGSAPQSVILALALEGPLPTTRAFGTRTRTTVSGSWGPYVAGSKWIISNQWFYSGFHHNSLTHYGCMNELAYRARFGGFFDQPFIDLPEVFLPRQDPEEGPDELPQEARLMDIFNDNEEEDEEGVVPLFHDPDIGIRIQFEIDCPIEVGPLRIAYPYWKTDRNFRSPTALRNEGFESSVVIFCYSAQASGLPAVYEWFPQFQPRKAPCQTCQEAVQK